jgi:hypothetical protein
LIVASELRAGVGSRLPVRNVLGELSIGRSGFQVNDRHGAARFKRATVRRFIDFAKRSARSTRSNVERERLQKLRTRRNPTCGPLRHDPAQYVPGHSELRMSTSWGA